MEIPRKLSVDERSPYYRPDVHDIGPLIQVTLDGQKIREVVEYDVDEGFVKSFIFVGGDPENFDEDGRSQVPVLATQHGRVAVEWKHMV